MMSFPVFYHLFHCIRSSDVFRCQVCIKLFVKENTSVASLYTEFCPVYLIKKAFLLVCSIVFGKQEPIFQR